MLVLILMMLLPTDIDLVSFGVFFHRISICTEYMDGKNCMIGIKNCAN